MSNIPDDLKYTKSHEWVRDNGNGTVTVGITDHAQELLGDIVFVELPEIDTEYGADDATGVLESVKAASDMYAPLTGEVTEVNEALDDAPETVNTDPYGEGWIFTMKLDSMEDLGELLTPEAYTEEAEA
ncbi:MAG: Glycine cleavage system H protein [uncultured Thiotrichaceae bacterium]|uniref:Glycine cleavage system H protein n=1 Tax=uncultured Thiotrichaceae bacterium TaxID=298394 RepID=A0A6S6TMP2_9GAMM|nr:MAG: Glycine cleavage system H protein [uncultured Thiotrichaceae bacterium]